jgi:hypothetical protein
MSLYEIKLADGDSVTYETDMTLEELKNYIITNDFIELPRSGTVPVGVNGWRRVPKLGSYQTKSIVYVNHNVELEECREQRKKIIEARLPMVNEIFKHEFNKRMTRWLRWNISDQEYDLCDDGLKESFCFYSDDCLKNILDKCKKYKCKSK